MPGSRSARRRQGTTSQAARERRRPTHGCLGSGSTEGRITGIFPFQPASQQDHGPVASSPVTPSIRSAACPRVLDIAVSSVLAVVTVEPSTACRPGARACSIPARRAPPAEPSMLRS